MATIQRTLPGIASLPPSNQANSTKTCSKCGFTLPMGAFSRCKQSKDGLRGRCRRCLNHLRSHPEPSLYLWTDEQIATLRDWYATHDGRRLELKKLAACIGKLKSNVSRKARQLGLTKQSRPTGHKPDRKYSTDAESRAAISASTKRYIREKGHPRGMLGLKHSQATRIVIGEKSSTRWQSMTEDQKAAQILNGLKTRAAHGTLVNDRPHGSWKSGWREIRGRRIYFRSRWEANYGRYLQWLQERGEVLQWEHEPETFWFNGAKRGCMNYLPDFRVRFSDDRVEYHEVKGWMDSRSAAKIEMMRKNYPETALVVIDSKRYHVIEKMLRWKIVEWEQGAY